MRTFSTSDPSSMTSPVISWPSTMPMGAVVRPRTMCWSEPQMLVENTFRITPCVILRPAGVSNFGSGIVSTATLPGPL